MPFDANSWKQLGKAPLIGYERILAPHVAAYADLKKGHSKAKYTAAYDAVKKAYKSWETLAAEDAKRNPANKQAHQKFLEIAKSEHNEIYLGLGKYNAKLQNAIAQRQNAIQMLTPWDNDLKKFVTFSKDLLDDAKTAWNKKDKVLAQKVVKTATAWDKRQWVEQCYNKYKLSTEPWRTGKTGLDANDLAAHVLPLTNQVYKLGHDASEANKHVQMFTAALNTAKAIK